MPDGDVSPVCFCQSPDRFSRATTASVALLGTMSSVEALKRLLTAVRDPATPVAVKRAAAATIPRVLQRIRKLEPKIEDVDLLHKLAEITPGALSRIYFCSGGSEAVETALKIAKQVQAMRGFPRRYKIIARRGDH